MSASHHSDGGSGPSSFDMKKIDALLARFTQQGEGKAPREYPEGRLGGDDLGALTFMVAADVAKGVIRVEFNKPVAWLAMSRSDAIALAKLIYERAKELPEHVAV